MKPRIKWLAAVLLLIAGPYYWLLIDNRPGSAPPRAIDLAGLRRLADAVPGPKPETIAVQIVGWRRVPGTVMAAGTGLKRTLVGIYAIRVRGPWGDVMIDSGFSAADADRLGLEKFTPAEQARVDAALRTARRIVVTHEHPDHLYGQLRLPDFARVAPRALILREQGPDAPLAGKAPWPRGARGRIAPFSYNGMTAIAPGVVLVRTPGHTPGSQMIYVRLAGGREVLFAGDTATMARNWKELRARSRLVSDFLAPEDRTAVFGWLKALQALHRAAPAVFIVPGHDFEYLLHNAPRDSFRMNFDPLAGERSE
ncbi:MAG: MBL fold metallo-hydrolase [Rhizorhabdus sp.]